MTTAGTTSVPLDIFGSLITDMAPADLPAGASPDCQDVKFLPGSVQTRGGLQSIFTPISGLPKVNYLKTYVTQSNLIRLLALDAAGTLWKESSQGVLSQIASGLVPTSYGKSTSLFTREYLAISDGKNGLDIPRQFDDTFLDRVSQVGPGIAPQANDENVSLATTGETQPAAVNIAASPTGAVESGFLVTITTTAPHGLVVNQNVIIAGVTVTGYNNGGTNPAFFVVLSVPSSTTFTYALGTSGLAASGAGTSASCLATYTTGANHGLSVNQLVTTSGITPAGYNVTGSAVFSVPSLTTFTLNLGVSVLAAGGAGTVANAGSIATGVHKFTVAFQTRQGAIFISPVTAQWTASGVKRVVVSNIPTGPPNVIARILIFTLAGQASYFYSSGITGVFSSNFIIGDNTTTSFTVDFTDVGLAASINADALFNQIELGDCAGVIDYSSRLFWWGERNKVNNFNNLSFDGGINALSPNQPAGWTQIQSGGTVNTANAYWAGCYAMTGDGVTVSVGKIQQNAITDNFGVPILAINTAYSVRVRMARLGSLFSQGNVQINFARSSNGTIIGGGFTFAASRLATNYIETIGAIMSAQTTLPSDLVLQVYMDGTPSASTALLDCIEIYPTNLPQNTSIVRTSKVELPEAYDGVTGFMSIAENDGYSVNAAFVIRENLYFVKDHGIYVTQDNGTTEPSQWKITEVSRRVGTQSVNGVAVGEDWAVIADRAGLFITDGGEPIKISQEIQPTWNRINWLAAGTIWTQVDVLNKRIYVGVPLDGALSPNKILMLDYRGCDTAAEIIANKPIHTTYTGKLIVIEKSRKWSPWTPFANSAAMVERFDGTQQLFLGNGGAVNGNGKIYELNEAQLGSDDGAGIPSYYTTYFHFSHELEQMLQLDSHNKLFTYLTQFVEGSGMLVVSAVPPGGSFSLGTSVPIAACLLSNPSVRDLELPMNITASRAAFTVSTSAAGEWFRLSRFIVNAIKHPSAPTRGWN